MAKFHGNYVNVFEVISHPQWEVENEVFDDLLTKEMAEDDLPFEEREYPFLSWVNLGKDKENEKDVITDAEFQKANHRHHPENRHERWMTNSGYKGEEAYRKEKEFRKAVRWNDTPEGHKHRDKIPGATSPKTWTNENYCKFRTVHAKRNAVRYADAICDYMNN